METRDDALHPVRELAFRVEGHLSADEKVVSNLDPLRLMAQWRGHSSKSRLFLV